MNEPLPACPKTPNAVSSEADKADALHFIEPISFSGDPAAAWARITEVVRQLPRTKVVESAESVLRAECRSLIFRFVDDLELRLRPDEGFIAVRAAARLGRHDFGVNRKRVETLRRMFNDAEAS